MSEQHLKPEHNIMIYNIVSIGSRQFRVECLESMSAEVQGFKPISPTEPSDLHPVP